MVVSNELKEPIRSHHDIDRDSAKHFKRASKVAQYYSSSQQILDRFFFSSMRHLLNAFLLMATLLTFSLAVSIKSGFSR